MNLQEKFKNQFRDLIKQSGRELIKRAICKGLISSGFASGFFMVFSSNFVIGSSRVELKNVKR